MRILKIVAGGVAFLVILLFGVLAETHLEMLRVDPELPSLEALAELRKQAGGPTRVRYVNTSSQAGDAAPATLAHVSVVLEWADGRSFLIDAGMRREQALEFGKLAAVVFGSDPAKAFGSIQEQLGAAAARVEGIAFTHLHSDHTDGLHALCAARSQELTVYQTPDQATRSNVSTWPGKASLRDAGCARPTTLAGGPPLFEVPGFSGLYAVAAGGHTPGSTIYLANMRGELWVLAGDITNFIQNLREDRAKPLAYRLLIGENSARQTRLRRWLGELDRRPGYTVVVAHDLEELQAVMPEWSAEGS
jgi:glyoxylase-like metal-dependent hydrolase (beta-lactamase superfamily II)